MAIPAGRPSVAWLTTCGNRQACVIAKIGHGRVVDTTHRETVYMSFPSFLSGTIFIGTFFFTNSARRFAIEDLGSHPTGATGATGAPDTYLNKLNTIKTLLTAMAQHSASQPPVIHFGIPAMADSMTRLEKLIDDQGISICQLKYRYFDRARARKTIVRKYVSHKRIVRRMVWAVSAELEDDIYTLHDNNNCVIGKALIPTYTSSVYMNQLFRRVRENNCLDNIEDSEEEDDFESDRIDQFVHLDRQIHMMCELHPRFKKWIPLYPVTPP